MPSAAVVAGAYSTSVAPQSEGGRSARVEPDRSRSEVRLVSATREVAESYWAAECRRDIDGVMTHYHEDATYQDGAGLLRGQAAIRQYYEASARD